MGWNLGKPILVMLSVSVLTGATMRFVHGSRPRGDLEMWSFSEAHFRAFSGSDKPQEPTLSDLFYKETGKHTQLNLIQFRALNSRLSSMFMSNLKGPELPDVVEVEIGEVGRYFRPAVDQIGFLPLNDLITEHGLMDHFVKNRFTPWSKNGVIFGLPHDVHPAMIAYNAELWEQAGIDLTLVNTWDQFQEAGLKYQAYWQSKGFPRRWAFEIPESNAGTLLAMLLQRGVNLVDDHGKLYINDPRVLDTLLKYLSMAAGPRRIGVDIASGEAGLAQDFSDGLCGALFCPDWRLTYIAKSAPLLSGKVKVMQLPRWPDSPYRTSTQGGTMIAITRNCTNPELAMKWIELLYFRPEGLHTTMKRTYILPPVRDIWSDPFLQQQDPYFSNQKVRQLTVQLADNVPPRYTSPATPLAETAMSLVLSDTLSYARSHGDDGLKEYCQAQLASAERELRNMIAHGKFDQ